MKQTRKAEKFRVFIIDDNRYFLESLTFILNMKRDMEVAGSCDRGLDCFERIEQDNPDIIILDLMLPDIDGLSLLGKIKTKFQDIPVIIFSIYDEYRQQALRRGAYAYLVKGEGLDLLYQAVRNGSLERRMNRLEGTEKEGEGFV